MSRIVDVESLGCLIWKDGEHGKTFDDGVLWVLEKIDELPIIEEQQTCEYWDSESKFCALCRPSVQTCDDAVSRKAAIDVLSLGKEILSRVLDDVDVVGTDREKYSWGLGLIESDIEDIKELPSVQPQRKTGKWIYAWNDYKCSVCGEIVLRHKYQFCPNCGAKMEGSK